MKTVNTFEDQHWAVTELKFTNRKMSKTEYKCWCSAHRNMDTVGHYLPSAAPVTDDNFKNHLNDIKDAVSVRHLPNWSRFAVDAYKALTPAYDNVLADKSCDEAGDYIDPEGDAMKAYERMTSDNFHALYGWD